MSGRLLIALPLYKDISVQWFLRFLALDKTPCTAIVGTRKVYLASAMTTTVADALQHDTWDRMVIYEADVLPPLDAFTRIAAYPDGCDIVGSAIFGHEPPHRMYAYTQHDETHYQAMPLARIKDIMATPGLYPCDAVGFGFTSISRAVFEKWPADLPMFGGETDLGHDMFFCREAARLGFTVRVDTGIECGHLTEIPVDFSHTMTQQEE